MSNLIDTRKSTDFRNKIFENGKIINERLSNSEFKENQDFRIETLRLVFKHDTLFKDMLEFLYEANNNFTSEGHDKIALIKQYLEIKETNYKTLIGLCQTIKLGYL